MSLACEEVEIFPTSKKISITTEGNIGDLSRALSATENCQKYSVSILAHKARRIHFTSV